MILAPALSAAPSYCYIASNGLYQHGFHSIERHLHLAESCSIRMANPARQLWSVVSYLLDNRWQHEQFSEPIPA